MYMPLRRPADRRRRPAEANVGETYESASAGGSMVVVWFAVFLPCSLARL
jgi:hypothetical protein